MRSNEPSRFLEEIPAKNFDPMSASIINPEPVFEKPKILGGISKMTALQPKSVNHNYKAIPPGEIATPDQILPGVTVLHAKFGKGTVIEVNGGQDNLIAKIKFTDLEDEEKHLVLRFAKLKIL
jgi:hypothetical protein